MRTAAAVDCDGGGGMEGDGRLLRVVAGSDVRLSLILLAISAGVIRFLRSVSLKLTVGALLGLLSSS